ncbi:hypothetical protein CHS0354_031229 [Potamilus streckersoni]|uniref:TLDc domain-containing protein n=1 Tax=Potamilus streckersoni TaxID=2493646 RepID=A0AAE0RMN8_9BIVA|nr:hypothetical protein CHS0354_031229 [Potamilus streckersoni]
MIAGQLSRQEKVKLERWIGEKAKAFELIYSIHRDGCNPVTFHLLCSNKDPTVTVLYNTDRSVLVDTLVYHGKVLMAIKFSGQPKYTKFPAKGGYNAIYDNAKYGPFFGTEHELGTFDTTLNKSGNYFTFIHGLTINNSYDIRNVQVQEINNGHTKIVELQVYKITDGPDEIEE